MNQLSHMDDTAITEIVMNAFKRKLKKREISCKDDAIENIQSLFNGYIIALLEANDFIYRKKADAKIFRSRLVTGMKSIPFPKSRSNLHEVAYLSDFRIQFVKLIADSLLEDPFIYSLKNPDRISTLSLTDLMCILRKKRITSYEFHIVFSELLKRGVIKKSNFPKALVSEAFKLMLNGGFIHRDSDYVRKLLKVVRGVMKKK